MSAEKERESIWNIIRTDIFVFFGITYTDKSFPIRPGTCIKKIDRVKFDFMLTLMKYCIPEPLVSTLSSVSLHFFLALSVLLYLLLAHIDTVCYTCMQVMICLKVEDPSMSLAGVRLHIHTCTSLWLVSSWTSILSSEGERIETDIFICPHSGEI